MQTSESKALVATLLAGYPRQKLNRESFNLYVVELEPFDAGVGNRAVRTLIRYEKWFPSIAQLLEECRNQKKAVVSERTERAWDRMSAATETYTREEYAALKAGEDAGPTAPE